MDDERRQFCRIIFHCPAQLVLQGQAFQVDILDFSLKGALVQLPPAALIPDVDVGQLFVQLDEDGEQICMEICLVHQQDQQLGLLCQALDIDSLTHLRRLVELNLGNSGQLEHEISTLVSP